VLAGFDVFLRRTHRVFLAPAPDGHVVFDPLHGSGFDCAGLFYLARHKTQASNSAQKKEMLGPAS
jgi:hypothetical protein